MTRTLLIVFLAFLVACSGSQRTSALQTGLLALNATRDGVLAGAKQRADQIIDAAQTKEEAKAALSAMWAKVDPVIEALDKGYRVLAAAALLSDSKSAADALAAIQGAVILAKDLKL